MVSAAVGSLVRRGLEMSVAEMQKQPKEVYQMPAWGAILLSVTVLFFVALSFMVEYTFGRVIPTLVMIESPEAIIFEPLTSDDPDAAMNKITDPELLLVEQKPITSSFRTAIRHLQSKGGFRARFRGLSVFVVNAFVIQWVSAMLNRVLPFLLAPIIATVLCAQLSVAWTWIVISDPNPKPWYRRVPSFRILKKVAGPTLILSVAEQAAVVAPVYLAVAFGFIGNSDDFANATPAQGGVMVTKAVSVLTVTLILAFLVVIPANVILVRVQASLLPDEVESIVPFDRSFGGKVNPEIVGGSGIIGMMDAWTTFDWSARVRLVKTYAKVYLMQFAIGFLFLFTIIAQIALIVGKDYQKLFPGEGKGGENVVFN